MQLINFLPTNSWCGPLTSLAFDSMNCCVFRQLNFCFTFPELKIFKAERLFLLAEGKRLLFTGLLPRSL